MPAASSTPPPAGPLTDAERPDWFRAFLTDRATRKPSPHTLQAYRQDFDAIATLIAGAREHAAAITPANRTKDAMRQAFAAYAATHEAASIRRCWSTWNTLCSFLFTAVTSPQVGGVACAWTGLSWDDGLKPVGLEGIEAIVFGQWAIKCRCGRLCCLRSCS